VCMYMYILVSVMRSPYPTYSGNPIWRCVCGKGEQRACVYTYMYVYMYVCLYVYIYIHIYSYIYTFIHTHKQTLASGERTSIQCTPTCINTHIHIHKRTQTHTFFPSRFLPNTHTYTLSQSCSLSLSRALAHTHTAAHRHRCTHTPTHPSQPPPIQPFQHTYTHENAHAHTHTNVHLHTSPFAPVCTHALILFDSSFLWATLARVAHSFLPTDACTNTRSRSHSCARSLSLPHSHSLSLIHARTLFLSLTCVLWWPNSHIHLHSLTQPKATRRVPKCMSHT